jgi:hypothetical protein
VGKGKVMKTIGLQKRLEIDYETLKLSALSLIIFPSHRHYGQKLSLIGVPYLSLGKIVDVHFKTKFICFSFQIVMPDPETMSHSHPPPRAFSEGRDTTRYTLTCHREMTDHVAGLFAGSFFEANRMILR